MACLLWGVSDRGRSGLSTSVSPPSQMGRGTATAGEAPENICATRRSACAIAAGNPGVLVSTYPVSATSAVGHVGMQPCIDEGH